MPVLLVDVSSGSFAQLVLNVDYAQDFEAEYLFVEDAAQLLVLHNLRVTIAWLLGMAVNSSHRPRRWRRVWRRHDRIHHNGHPCHDRHWIIRIATTNHVPHINQVIHRLQHAQACPSQPRQPHHLC